MVPHVVIVTGQHMVSNPRVWKESNTLSRAGFRVTLLTIHNSPGNGVRDAALLDPSIRYIPVVNLARGGSDLSDVYLSRARLRSAQILKRLFDWESIGLLAYRPGKMLKAALKEKAELYICHQETGLVVGELLLRHRRRVAFDMEDWYSHDYINKLRPVRLLSSLEGQALRKAAFVTCPSRSMAKAIAKEYDLPDEPSVLYNGFSTSENEGISENVDVPDSLVWFSQVIGPGRGLETLLEAMVMVKKPMQVHLLGDAIPDFKCMLEQGFSATPHRLTFHAPLDHERLLPFISRFDIGLAIERRQPESRNTTVTNKILQYLQAGNRILATDTSGQLEVRQHFNDRILMVPVDCPVEWASAIERLNAQPGARSAEQFRVFRDVFSWEAQEPQLLKLVEGALGMEPEITR